MVLEDMIGLQLAVGLPGPDATPELIAALRASRAQSLVVFSRNFTSPEQFTVLLRRLHDALGRRLLVMVDHEGGRVVRFRQGLTPFPAPLAVGRDATAQTVERQGAVEAQELRRLGVQVNLAPCADVLVEGCDPVIGDRSYGSDPHRVATLCAARIQGLQAHGVAACAKHFPGLGAVPTDPHQVLPTIAVDWAALERIHLPPFRAAIAGGVAAIMSSHVCYPGLGDPKGLPATFSRALIRGLLRQRLGFQGLILTDALEMGALRAFGTIGESAVRAAEAGHDLFLICCPELAPAEEALACLREAYKGGRLDRRELEASANRISQLRKKYLSGPLEESS
jgi:beta-N-acetylhexosaminidase